MAGHWLNRHKSLPLSETVPRILEDELLRVVLSRWRQAVAADDNVMAERLLTTLLAHRGSLPVDVQREIADFATTIELVGRLRLAIQNQDDGLSRLKMRLSRPKKRHIPRLIFGRG